MKSLTITLCCLALSIFAYAQEEKKPELETTINSIKISYIGLNLSNEIRLSRKLSLNTNLQLSPSNLRSNGADHSYVVYPDYNLETRWYTNLDRRAAKGKRTDANTGNAWSLRATYSPDLLLLTNQNYTVKSSLLSIGPSYTIRRTFWKNFNFEGSLNARQAYIFRSTREYLPNQGAYLEFSAGIKIGYQFVRK
jgi:hypothetical protein